MSDKYPEKNIRDSLHFLLNSLTVVHNEYGAGGSWGGVPIPLYEISKRLDVAESILTHGSKETIELMQAPKGDFSRSSKLAQEYFETKLKELDND